MGRRHRGTDARHPLRRRTGRRALRARAGAHDDRPLARLRHLPRRRHGVAPARRRLKQGDAFVIEDQGSLNGTFLNRRRIESAELSDDDELQIGSTGSCSSPDDDDRPRTEHLPTSSQARDDRSRLQAAQRRVPGHLDLEDPVPRGPGPPLPARTPGGYRLFSEEDIERLESILRLSATSSSPCGSSARSSRRGSPRAAGAGAPVDLAEHDRRDRPLASSASAPHLAASSRETSRSTGCCLRRSAAASATTPTWTWRRRSRAAGSRRRA